jgi:tartrate dehydratase alpha subunit/fumarate hydratase class I-like protein
VLGIRYLKRRPHDRHPAGRFCFASVAAALQFISYYHPVDFIRGMARAYEREESPAARDAMAQILINSRMCAEGHRPICQDTGIVTAFLKVGHGRDVRDRCARRRKQRHSADGR